MVNEFDLVGRPYLWGSTPCVRSVCLNDHSDGRKILVGTSCSEVCLAPSFDPATFHSVTQAPFFSNSVAGPPRSRVFGHVTCDTRLHLCDRSHSAKSTPVFATMLKQHLPTKCVVVGVSITISKSEEMNGNSRAPLDGCLEPGIRT